MIDEAWPLQKKGLVPPGGVKKVAAVWERLASFEPETKAQEALHETALHQFNVFFEHRRTRLYRHLRHPGDALVHGRGRRAIEHDPHVAVRSSPQPSFAARRHPVLLPLATMISLIVLMDHPFLGEVSISPHAFELVHDQLMKE